MSESPQVDVPRSDPLRQAADDENARWAATRRMLFRLVLAMEDILVTRWEI